MDENNNFIESEKTDSKKHVTEFTVQKETKKQKTSNSSSVIVPFVSGILGAAIVVGSCFGIPTFRDSILNSQSSSINSTNQEINTGVNSNIVSLKEYSETGIQVAAKVLPSVVGITVEYPVNSIFSRASTTASAEGSGVIISADGYILTNNHVVSNSSSTSSSGFYEVGEASKVTVYLYGDTTGYEAKIIGTDSQTDLAVIKIDKDDLTAAELGDSDSLQVGEFAMAIGNPLGMESSVSAGIISAVNRKVTSDNVTYTLVQTDAAINSGNSGGALVNSKGQVIGINTLKLAGSSIEGMGFAIPINSTKEISNQLIEYQKVKRPYIGITGRDLSEDLAKANNLPVGIYVVNVEEFSSAEKAGIKAGDVITEINGTKVKTMNELNEEKNKHSIGETIAIKITRNNEEKTIELTLQEQ